MKRQNDPWSQYGLRGDGVSDDSAAFARCFGDIRKTGGGLITIPPGNYFLSGNPAIPLCSGLTIMAQGVRFLLPERLPDGATTTLFSGTDIRDLTWQGGHFEGYCFDPRRPDNTWEPNVSTRAIAIDTTPGGDTGNLRYREISGHRLAGAVITVQGVVEETPQCGHVDTFVTGISVQDCRLMECGPFMWDYGLLWQMIVWAEEYPSADVERAWRYFRQDLARRPIALRDGDDRVRCADSRAIVAASGTPNGEDTVCFFGRQLPFNIKRGQRYYVLEAGDDYIRIGPTPNGPAIRFAGSAGDEAGLICNLPQAYYHLFRPTGSAPGKGAVDLVGCRQTLQTGNRLSALGDTMHMQYCHDNIFSNNQITGSRMGAFFIAEYCKHSVVTGNTVDGTNGSRVMSVEKSSENVTITGNTFRNGGRGSWINQPQGFILCGNVFVNNTTKGERDARRGRRSLVTGDYERFPELYFTTYESDGRYGPVIIRNNLFVTGDECAAAIDFAPRGYDLVVAGNVFEGPVRSVRVDAQCERVNIGNNQGIS